MLYSPTITDDVSTLGVFVLVLRTDPVLKPEVANGVKSAELFAELKIDLFTGVLKLFEPLLYLLVNLSTVAGVKLFCVTDNLYNFQN